MLIVTGKVVAITLLFVPITVTCVIIIFTFCRTIVSLLLYLKYGQWIEFLTGPDASVAMNVTGSDEPCRIHGYGIRKGQLTIDQMRERVESNWLLPRNADGSYKHKRLRSILQYDMGYYFWLPNNDFRIEDYVFFYEGPRPKNEEEFHRVLGHLVNIPFKVHSSPWQVIAIRLDDQFSTLEPGPHDALLFRFQHYLCDGVSILRLIGALADEPYDQAPIIPRRTFTPLSRLRYGLEMLIVAPIMSVRQIFSREKHILCLPGKMTCKTLVGFTSYISTDRYKGLKSRLRCTVNDVVMSCIAGAFRAHFLAEGAPVPDCVTMMIPISQHDFSTPATFRNYSTLAPYKFPVNAETPLERIQAIKKSSDSFKKSILMDYTFIVLVKGICRFAPIWMIEFIINRIQYTGVMSNLIGPQEIVLYDGSPFIRQGFLVAFTGGATGIGVSVLTNVYGMQFGLRVDRALFKEQVIVERFLKFIVAEFEELEKAEAALSMH